MPSWFAYPARSVRDFCTAPPSNTPVFTDYISTGLQTVTAGSDIISTLVTALGVQPFALFGSTPPAAGAGVPLVQPWVLGSRLTALRVTTKCTFQSGAAASAGNPPDRRVAELLERVLEGMDLTVIETDAQNAAGTPTQAALLPIPVRAYRDGVVFPEALAPYCRQEEFQVQLLSSASGPLRQVAIGGGDVLASLEYRFEAVFEHGSEA